MRPTISSPTGSYYTNRRVVTGLDADGRSAVVSDMTLDQIDGCRSLVALIWRTEGFPVDNDGVVEASQTFESTMLFDDASSMFVMVAVEPGLEPNWHATGTIDYLVVMHGRVALQLENGRVELGPGDLVVDRGVRHSWEALDDRPAVLLVTLVRARPLAAGVGWDTPAGT